MLKHLWLITVLVAGIFPGLLAHAQSAGTNESGIRTNRCTVCHDQQTCTVCQATGKTKCDQCAGSGKVKQSCTKCGGDGRDSRTVRRNGKNVRTTSTCSICHGTGKAERNCSRCNGSRTVPCKNCQGQKQCPACAARKPPG